METILISVISMLADPNGDSPANVDAAVRAFIDQNFGSNLIAFYFVILYFKVPVRFFTTIMSSNVKALENPFMSLNPKY